MKQLWRLRDSEIRLLLKQGKRLAFPLFSLVTKKNSVGRGRLVVVIPKTVDKRSVVRNRLRRRVREWFRKNPALRMLPYDTVVFLKKGIVAVEHQELYKELVYAFQKKHFT